MQINSTFYNQECQCRLYIDHCFLQGWYSVQPLDLSVSIDPYKVLKSKLLSIGAPLMIFSARSGLVIYSLPKEIASQSLDFSFQSYFIFGDYWNMLSTVLKVVFSGYLACSALSFLFPTLLHQKHTYSCEIFRNCLEKGRIMRIAHRGGTRQKVENTISAFRKAEACTDMLEMDVCETRDNVLVVHHDQTLYRTTGLNRPITQVQHANLPRIQQRVELHFTEDVRAVQSQGETIPTLEQVFQKFPKMPMNIEIKTPSITAVLELRRLIHQYNRLDITFVGVAGKNSTILEDNFPQSHRFVSYANLPKLALFYFTGLLGFCKIPQKVLQIPLYTKEYQAMKKRQLGHSRKTNLLFAGIRAMNVVGVPLIWHLKQRGVMVYFWVCNSQRDFERARQLGCCGIMTDEAELLESYISKQQG